MLFHWSWTEDHLQSADLVTLRNLTTELIRASRRGNHLISISRIVSAWICTNIDLSGADKAHLIAIGSKYTQTGGLYRRASFYIEVANINHDFELFDGGAKASPNYVVKSNLLDPGRLIVENVDNDGWLLNLLIRHFRKRVGLVAISVSIDHGGGRDVVRVLSQKISEKRIACLITDSDKKFPSDKKSTTVKAAVRVCSESKSPFCFVIELPCHEIENLIPIEVAENIQSATGSLSIGIHQAIDALEQSVNCDYSERYWMFFDMKKGITEESLAKMPSDGALWHNSKLEAAGIEIGQRSIAGFGDRIIPQVSASGLLTSALLKCVESKQWRNSFYEIFATSCWIFAGDRVNIT